jgi:ABC-2 type transport system ATP-binding protein
MSLPAPLLEAHAVSKRFGARTALAEVNLRVAAGEIYCLLGANGAGKTTLIQLFLGLLAPDAGRLSVAGLDVSTSALASKRHLAFIPEQVMLYPSLSGLENLDYFASLALNRRLSPAEGLSLLARAGIAESAAHARVATYSKGMRQKVGIAVALAREARVLLLDEPTSGLDPVATGEFSELLRAARDRGAAILMTSHDLFHARLLASRIGFLRDGRLATELSGAELAGADLEALYRGHLLA